MIIKYYNDRNSFIVVILKRSPIGFVYSGVVVIRVLCYCVVFINVNCFCKFVQRCVGQLLLTTTKTPIVRNDNLLLTMPNMRFAIYYQCRF